MHEDDVFYMSIMQRCQWTQDRQQQEQRVDQYNVVRKWKMPYMERYLYPLPIMLVNQGLLRNVGVFKYCEEAISLKYHSRLLVQLIHRWDIHWQNFCVRPDMWYHTTKEDTYFIIGLCRRGEDFPWQPDVPLSVAKESQLIYSQRYIGDHVVSPMDFQVFGGQLWISSFGAEEVRCLSLLVTTISHSSNDGKHISFPLLLYVDSLVQSP